MTFVANQSSSSSGIPSPHALTIAVLTSNDVIHFVHEIVMPRGGERWQPDGADQTL
jgi:hypothetical protein